MHTREACVHTSIFVRPSSTIGPLGRYYRDGLAERAQTYGFPNALGMVLGEHFLTL